MAGRTSGFAERAGGLLAFLALFGGLSGAGWVVLTQGADPFNYGFQRLGLEIAAAAFGLAAVGLGFSRRLTLAVLVGLLALLASGSLIYLTLLRATPAPSPVAAPAPPTRSPLVLPGVQTWSAGEVPFCWLNKPNAAPGGGDEKKTAAVYAAMDAWAHAGDVHFRDTGACKRDFQGVRLLVRRTIANPDTPALGAALALQDEPVTIPFTFPARSGCRNGGRFGEEATCTYGEAVHEFGHVLGLADEHYSQTAPAECQILLRKDHPSLPVPYDAASVMNGCNPDHLVGKLSSGDAEAVRLTYGPAKP